MSIIFRSILKQWLWADYMLYEHFKKLLQKRLLDFGEDAIQRKVKLLKVRRKNAISDKFAVNVRFVARRALM